MKELFLTLLLCALPIYAVAQLSDVPDVPKVDAKYFIYLHGVGIEKVGIAKANEHYNGIVKALEGRGFIVISEVRSSNTKVNEYGKKVAGQVIGLITKGVPPENISVVGYSKGGLITLWAAAAGDNPKVNYVVLAGCVLKGSENYDTYMNKVAPKLEGRILSMFDSADPDRGTCKDFFEAAGNKVTKAADAPSHCDTMDGPVIQAAQKALDTGDVTLVLVWVQKRDEGAPGGIQQDRGGEEQD